MVDFLESSSYRMLFIFHILEFIEVIIDTIVRSRFRFMDKVVILMLTPEKMFERILKCLHSYLSTSIVFLKAILEFKRMQTVVLLSVQQTHHTSHNFTSLY